VKSKVPETRSKLPEPKPTAKQTSQKLAQQEAAKLTADLPVSRRK